MKRIAKERVDNDETRDDKQPDYRVKRGHESGRLWWLGVVFPYVPHICDGWYLRVFLDPSVMVIFSIPSLGSFFSASFLFPFLSSLLFYTQTSITLEFLDRNSHAFYPDTHFSCHAISLSMQNPLQQEGQSCKRGYRSMCTFSDTKQPRYNSWTTCPPFIHCMLSYTFSFISPVIVDYLGRPLVVGQSSF